MTTTNQFIKPLTTKINNNGNLEIGGCDLIELVKTHGTPLYVMDEVTLRSVCQDYKKAFAKYPKTQMMYASKALCTLATSKIIFQEGFGFDVVSGGEIYTLYKAGVDMSKVLFNGNNKLFNELNLALDLGVGRISVDNFYELSLLDNLAKEKNVVADVLLRVTPGIECHTHEYIQTGHLDSKFGFDLSQIDEAIKLILCEYKNLKLRGLHAHIGSQIFETSVYSDEIEILVKEFARIKKSFNIDLDEMNIGGGLGVKYVENDCPPSIDEIAEAIISKLYETAKNMKLICQL